MPTKVKGTTGVDKIEAGAVITNPEFSGNATVTGTLTVNSTASINGSNISTQPSFRNLIINGDMKIAQRATSATASVDNAYKTLDRWKTNFSSGAFTSEQYSMSSSELQTTGFSKAIKYACTTAVASPSASDFVLVRTPLEAQYLQHLQYGTSSAKTVTLSFWIKSNITGTYGISLWKPDNTSSIIVDSITISSANTWEKKTVSFVGDTANGVIDDDNGEGLRVSIALMLGTDRVATAGSWMAYAGDFGVSGNANFMSSTSNTLYLTGVQLEVGTNASDFEFLPNDVQLARCQRYYYLHCEGNQRGVANGAMYTASVAYANIKFPVNMRADPSLEVTSGNNFRAFAGNGLSTATSVGIWSQHGTTNEFITLSGLARTQGQACFIDTNDAACKLAFSAEL